MKYLLQPRKMLILALLISSLGLFSQTHILVPVNQPENLAAHAGIDTTIQEGLSIQLGGSPAASGGNEGYIFVWSPADGIDDVNVANPMASPSSDITYSLLVSDLNECTSSDEISIFISQANALDLHRRNTAEIYIYPNPATSQIRIRIDGDLFKNFTLTLINSSGKILYNNTYDKSKEIVLPIDRSVLTQGMYFILLRNSEFSVSKKLIIN